MRNFLRIDFRSAFKYDATSENRSGGTALWDIPARIGCIFNPLVFTRTKYFHFDPVHTEYQPAAFGYFCVPNFVRFEGTTIKFDFATESTVYVKVDTDAGEITAAVFSGKKDYYLSNSCKEIYSILSVSFTQDYTEDYCTDIKYIYIRLGYEYSDDTFVCSADGKYLFRDCKTIDTVTLNVYRLNDTYTGLHFEPYKGVVKFDVSSLIKSWLRPNLNEFNGRRVIEDGALSVKYIIKGIGGPGYSEMFLAVNAVAQIRESSDLTPYVDKVLTKFPRLYQYGDYPLDYTVLKSSNVKTKTSKEAVASFSTLRRLVTGTSLNLLAEDGRNILENASGAVIKIMGDYDIPVFLRCVPKYPFYVRWINRLGGVDYWMFSRTQTHSPSVKSSDVYAPYVENPVKSSTNSLPYGLTTEHQITVGAEQLNKAEFRALSELPYSPLIEVLDEVRDAWIRLSVASFDGTDKTDSETKSVEVKFNLPTINVQF